MSDLRDGTVARFPSLQATRNGAPGSHTAREKDRGGRALGTLPPITLAALRFAVALAVLECLRRRAGQPDVSP